MNKIYNFINKIGKQNIILIIFILFVISITSLYQTFSLVTTTDTSSIIEGLLTYKFILNSDNNNYSITVAANSSKNAMLTVSNTEEIKLKYGIYYGSTSSLTSVKIGYLSTSEHQGTGLIEGKTDYIVYLKIKNDSSSDITINFGVSYGFENGGDLLLDTGKHWLSNYETKLSSVALGSYVKYTGSNGCTGNSCSGQNANYVSDSDMGYCSFSAFKFNVNGWRIAYIKNDSAYLISAGALECMCTNSDLSISTSCGSSAESSSGVPSHLANLNKKALTYCNSIYAYGGVCNSSSAWNINDEDFKTITKVNLETAYQNTNVYDSTNSLINNGGFYWFATSYSSGSSAAVAFAWLPDEQSINAGPSSGVGGVRPVLRLNPNVIVTGGTGTYADPYQISLSDG